MNKRRKEEIKKLVVSKDKTKRGCYELYGWTKTDKRNHFTHTINGYGIELRIITKDKYIEDFNDFDKSIAEENISELWNTKELLMKF